MHDLDLLFNPSSVAVIGASSDRNKLSGRTIHFLKTYGFKGKIFPVNPSSPEIQFSISYPHTHVSPPHRLRSACCRPRRPAHAAPGSRKGSGFGVWGASIAGALLAV